MRNPHLDSDIGDVPRTDPTSFSLDSLSTDSVVVFLALWTISSHIVVAAGGSLLSVIWLFAALVAGGTALAWTFRSSALLAKSAHRNTDAPPAMLSKNGDPLLLGAVVSTAAVVGFFVSRRGENPLLLWWWIAVILTFGVWWVISKPGSVSPQKPTTRSGSLALLGVSLTCIGLALGMHRWDADDVFYVGLATSVADSPHAAILAHDFMHGIKNLPLHLPLYRVQSWEILMGAISLVSGIPAIVCFHWLAAGAAAFLMPLAWARLFKILVPERWLWATVTVLVVLIAIGDSHRWYGSFGLVRIWQGKAFFLSVLYPLIAAYGLEFGRRPTVRRGIMVTTAVIASIGATVNALWLAPLAAVVAIASASARLTRLRAATGAAVASIYPITLAVLVRGNAAAALQRQESTPSIETWTTASETVFGSPTVLLVSLVAVASAWSVGLADPARRFAALSSAVAWMTVLNPYTIDLVTENVVGPFYWRVWWAVPIPMLLALFLTWPAGDRILTSWSGRMVSAGLTIALVVIVPGSNPFSADGEIRFHRPALKVPPIEFQWAQSINEEAPPGSHVVAPRTIGNLLLTLHNHAFPLEARKYLRTQRSFVPESDLELRRLMISIANGRRRHPVRLRRFRQGLDEYEISAVCFHVAENDRDLRSLLSDSGFILRHGDTDYELWTRRPTPSGAEIVTRDLDQAERK